MLPRRSLLLPMLALATYGCRFGPECSEIAVHMPATLERDGLMMPIDLHGRTYSYSIFLSPEPFDRALEFLIRGGVTSTSTAVAWSFGTQDTGGVIGLRGPRELGDIVQVTTGAFQPAYITDPRAWGPTTLSGPAPAEAILEAPGFRASQTSGGNVSGTLTVLATQPLRLDVDLLALDAGGAELRLRGEMSFEAVSATCP